MSAQLITYNIPGVTAHLKLTGKADLEHLPGQDHQLERRGHRGDQQGVTLPNLPIVTLHRSDSSGDTFLFTSFLSDADPSGWGKTVASTRRCRGPTPRRPRRDG